MIGQQLHKNSWRSWWLGRRRGEEEEEAMFETKRPGTTQRMLDVAVAAFASSLPIRTVRLLCSRRQRRRRQRPTFASADAQLPPSRDGTAAVNPPSSLGRIVSEYRPPLLRCGDCVVGLDGRVPRRSSSGAVSCFRSSNEVFSCNRTTDRSSRSLLPELGSAKDRSESRQGRGSDFVAAAPPLTFVHGGRQLSVSHWKKLRNEQF